MKHADNTSAVIIHKSINITKYLMIGGLQTCLFSNNLSLNIDKSVTNRGKPKVNNLTLQVISKTVTPIISDSFWGIQIDERLNYKGLYAPRTIKICCSLNVVLLV